MLIYDTPQHIIAFSTTRNGCVSIDIPQLIMPLHQTHDIVTRIIDESFISLNPIEQALALDGVDALSTQLTNLCICVRTADCTPLLLWDDRTHVVSAIHAGWKGTLKRIAEANIDVLKETFGTKAEHLHAIIGPCIGPDSFEVGDEVYEKFKQAGFPMESLATKHPDSRNPQALKWHINLWECNKMQLIGKGVSPKNIHVSGIDTYQHFDRFHSARRNSCNRIINGIMRKRTER